MGQGNVQTSSQNDHTGNKFLSHPFRHPVRLAAQAEEAVIGLGLDAPGPHFFGQAMGCLFDLGLTSLSTFFSHIATVSGCGRELNAHF